MLVGAETTIIAQQALTFPSQFYEDTGEFTCAVAHGVPEFGGGVGQRESLPKELGETLPSAWIGESMPSSLKAPHFNLAFSSWLALRGAGSDAIIAALLIKMLLNRGDGKRPVGQHVVGQNAESLTNQSAIKTLDTNLLVTAAVGVALVIAVSIKAPSLIFVIKRAPRR